MSNLTREPFLAYILVHSTTLRRRHGAATEAADGPEEHAQALDLLADLVRALPEDDERLLLLGTLVVRGGKFAPGPASEHALAQFAAVRAKRVTRFLPAWYRSRATMPSHVRAPTAICQQEAALTSAESAPGNVC